MNTPIKDLFALAEEAIAPVIWTEKKAVQKFKESATPERVREVAEAFRELEQRAEAAEAKLAELAKQEPAAFRLDPGEGRSTLTFMSPERLIEEGCIAEIVALYTRPAPAADLSEMVPDAPTGHECPEHILDPFSWACGAEWFRAAILRNIEGAK